MSTVNFTTSYSPFYIQDSLSRLLRTISDLDQLYYALVDLSGYGIRPPILALNAVLLSAGQVASLDRAFSLLQEYESTFQIKPSLESYCALVDAVGRANPPRVSVLVAVLQVSLPSPPLPAFVSLILDRKWIKITSLRTLIASQLSLK